MINYTIKENATDGLIDYRDLKAGEYAVVEKFVGMGVVDGRLAGSIVKKETDSEFSVKFVTVKNNEVPNIKNTRPGSNLSNSNYRLRRLKVVEMVFELA